MAAIDDLIKQILGQNTTAKWTGEGYGGAEANAKAMAKLLADAGITDIKQFGKIDKYEPVEVTGYSLNGNTVQNPSKGVFYEQIPQYDGEGGIQGYQTRYLSPQEAAQVKPQYGIVESDADGGRVVRPVTNVVEKNGQLLGVTGQTYGNKATGQAIESGTGRWQKQGGEGLFSGTGEGKGNTAFRVDFTPDGTPVFYTTQGTSNDLALAIQGLGPIGSIAANYLAMQFGGPAGVAALNAAQGKDFKDVAKATLLAYAGGEASKAFGGAPDTSSLSPTDSGGLLGTPNDLGIDYSLSNGTAMRQLTDMGGAQGLQAGTAANLDAMGGGQGFQFNAGAPVTSVADAVKAISSMNGSFNPDNLASMGGGQGLTYQTPTGLVTEGGTLNVGGMTGNNSVISQGGIDTASNIGSDIAKRVAAIETGVDDIKMPTTPTEPVSSKSPLSVSDAIRLAGIGATLAGGAKLASGGGGGYDIVPIPTDWTSPIKPTGTAEFTPLAPIDFGNKEMLRGTQWEQLLSPDYGKAPAMPSMPTNPSNMDFNQLMGILGNTRTSIPTQSVSINDVIAGIQSQYGQTPTSSMG